MANFPGSFYMPPWPWPVKRQLFELLEIDHERIKVIDVRPNQGFCGDLAPGMWKGINVYVQDPTAAERKAVFKWMEANMDAHDWTLWWDETEFRIATTWPKGNLE